MIRNYSVEVWVKHQDSPNRCKTLTFCSGGVAFGSREPSAVIGDVRLYGLHWGLKRHGIESMADCVCMNCCIGHRLKTAMFISPRRKVSKAVLQSGDNANAQFPWRQRLYKQRWPQSRKQSVGNTNGGPTSFSVLFAFRRQAFCESTNIVGIRYDSMLTNYMTLNFNLTQRKMPFLSKLKTRHWKAL